MDTGAWWATVHSTVKSWAQLSINDSDDDLDKADAEAEAPVLWSPDANSQLIGKVPFSLGKIEGRRKRGRQWVRWLDGITDAMDMNLGKLQEMVRDREAWCFSPWGYKESTQLVNWTTRKLITASQVMLVVKNPPANAGDIRDAGSVSGLGRSPEGGHGNPLQYSCLENPLDKWTWQAIVHRVAKSWTWLKWLSTHAHKAD